MSAQTVTRTAPAAPEHVSRRSVAVLGAVLLLPALAYALTVPLPWYASDLDQLPLAELAAGASDPELPGDSRLLTLAGFVALLLAPLGALLALGGSLLQLLATLPTDRRTIDPRAAVGLAAVALASTAVLLWFLLPVGSALTSWQLD